jgi:hypothetical protein
MIQKIETNTNTLNPKNYESIKMKQIQKIKMDKKEKRT